MGGRGDIPPDEPLTSTIISFRCQHNLESQVLNPSVRDCLDWLDCGNVCGGIALIMCDMWKTQSIVGGTIP